MAAGTNGGLTLTELVQKINDQAAVAVSDSQVRKALDMLKDCTRIHPGTRKVQHTLAA